MRFAQFMAESQYDGAPDHWWTFGLCTVFANALHKKFGLPIFVLFEESLKDKDRTLMHAVCRYSDRAVDAEGVHHFRTYMLGLSTPHYYPGEKTHFIVEEMTPDNMQEWTVEDVNDTAAADKFINDHPKLFEKIVS